MDPATGSVGGAAEEAAEHFVRAAASASTSAPSGESSDAAAGGLPLGVLVAVVVMLLTILLLALRRGGGKGSVGGKRAVIVGPCNSGKTALFHALVGSVPPAGTVASMQENDGPARLKAGGTARCVDVPGHERLRHKLDGHLGDARAVVFVLDAVEITPHRTEAAEELFEVLTHPAIHRRRVPVLLACNKMDQELEAHSPEFIERTLQKQLDAMRKTRGALSPEAAAKAALLGRDTSKPFTFAGLGNSVKVAPISALQGDIAAVHEFLSAMR